MRGAPEGRSNNRDAPNVIEIVVGISQPEGMNIQAYCRPACGTDARAQTDVLNVSEADKVVVPSTVNIPGADCVIVPPLAVMDKDSPFPADEMALLIVMPPSAFNVSVAAPPADFVMESVTVILPVWAPLPLVVMVTSVPPKENVLLIFAT